LTCNRYEIAEFAKKALALGVNYQGVCCGAGPHHIRAMAEALGKSPPASRYTADMSKHYALGDHAQLVKENMAFAKEM
jgi:betaine-homocysteine S-methyltransferase